MKALFKITLLSAAFIGCLNVSSAQVNFGVKAGANLSTVNVSNLEGLDPKFIVSFQVGAIADINISDQFVLQPGLLLTGKGFKIEDEFLGETYKTTATFYLQVPVNFMYKSDKFYVGAGPYVGFGLFGNFKYEGGGDSESESIDFGTGEDDDWTPLDFGANLEAGVILNQIRIGAGYALGLANVIPDSAREGDEKVTNGVISVNVAYMFGGKSE